MATNFFFAANVRTKKCMLCKIFLEGVNTIECTIFFCGKREYKKIILRVILVAVNVSTRFCSTCQYDFFCTCIYRKKKLRDLQHTWRHVPIHQAHGTHTCGYPLWQYISAHNYITCSFMRLALFQCADVPMAPITVFDPFSINA